MSAENGNGTARVLWWAMGIFGSLIVAGSVAWASNTASAGQRALERVQAIEVSQASVNATSRADVETLKRDVAEIKKTTNAIWRAIDGKRKPHVDEDR